VAAVAVMSAGLYGFGMSLNDIIDRRRDRQMAAHRPLPSGRLGLGAAHVICALLLLIALWAGAAYARTTPGDPRAAWISLSLVAWTAGLICFYDFTGKYLVALGLLSLGFIRFFHALIPAPQMPLVWHPLLLLNHVTIVSTVAYHWEKKRPPLTRIHWFAVMGGLAFCDALLIVLVAWRRIQRMSEAATIYGALRIEPGLIYPALAAVAFVGVAALIRRRRTSDTEAGQSLMLYGLLWLIVYDAAFVTGYVGVVAGAIVLALLPIAYLSVRFSAWCSKMMALSHRPKYKRAAW
jgi:hypothetical protein